MHALLSYCKNKLVIKKSIFLSEAFPIDKVEDVKKILKIQKEKYKEARHVVHSFVIGEKVEYCGFSDDGEPKGTAGHPSLAVLQHYNVTNILITITRWFGGILLGSGGLVRAYQDSTKYVLDIASFREIEEETCFKITSKYEECDTVLYLLKNLNATIIDSQYSEKVSYLFKIPNKNKKAFISNLKNKTKALIEELSIPNQHL